MQIGVSTSCYYPRLTEEALDILLEGGVKTLEIFFNTHSELEPAFLRELRRRAEDAGAQIVSIHPYTSGMEGLLFFSDYGRRFEDAREYYRNYYEAAAILGASIVVFHGGFKVQTLPVEEYARRIDLLDEDARRAGVHLAQENVERCLSRSPEFLRRLRELRPSQQFVLDIKQSVRAGFDPYTVAAAMGEGVVHLHLSDHTAEKDCLPPGAGQMDYRRLFQQLKQQNFDGTAVVELYRSNFEHRTELLDAVRLLQRICRSI